MTPQQSDADQLAFYAKLMEVHKALALIDFPKTSFNPHFKSSYCPLEVVMEKVLPVLHGNGIMLIQQVTTIDDQPALLTRLQTVSGRGIESTMLLLPQSQNAQAQGAAVTYARRYALQTILGITPEDDVDGNGPRPAAAPTGAAQGVAQTPTAQASEPTVAPF